MFRFIITVLFLAIFGILSIFILGVLWVIGRFKPEVKSKASLAIAKVALRIVSVLAGVKLKVLGLENVPSDEPVLYVANHASFFDIVLTLPLVKTETAYISKKENRFPVLTQYMENMHGMFFDRNDIRQGMQVILNAIDLIKRGISVFIFPEGTRTKTGEMNPFKEGSFKVATKTGCKIVPIAISGTSAIFEDHLPLLKAGEVIIEYGDPFVISDLSDENKKFPGKYTQEIIRGMLNAHKMSAVS